ncbi:hypothetical protein AB6A40_007913 [Gnathostoma spinigerum]|uniref:G-protein coupled receptors family 1 profile domain-containing protein n=1 Tax=Gnathostoma spinigerum TaxID=75299 RepID=A0ABD6ESR4_9BILA
MNYSECDETVTICVISVDRYLAVTRPLRYKAVVTKTKVVITMCIIWSFSSTILLATVRWDKSDCFDTYICYAGHEIRYLAHSVIFAFFLPASVTLTLYWRIYRLARKRQRALDSGFLVILGRNMNFLTNTLTQQTALRVHIGKNSGMVEQQRRVLRTHERIAKTLGVVSCSFLFCWLPFFALYLTNHKCQCILTVVIDIASWLGYCNSMLNPIIYSFTVKEFKRSAIQLILPFWKLLHQWLPKLIKAPPEHATSRMRRQAQQFRCRRQRSRSTKPYQTLYNAKRQVNCNDVESRRRLVRQPISETIIDDSCANDLLSGKHDEFAKEDGGYKLISYPQVLSDHNEKRTKGNHEEQRNPQKTIPEHPRELEEKTEVSESNNDTTTPPITAPSVHVYCTTNEAEL